nr:uncharacterized protein LOC127323208 [Lolium perenne]
MTRGYMCSDLNSLQRRGPSPARVEQENRELAGAVAARDEAVAEVGRDRARFHAQLAALQAADAEAAQADEAAAQAAVAAAEAALAASREQCDLDELAKWSHLAETLRVSALEEKARKAQEDAQAEAWAFLEMARRQEEATRQAALREEEERRTALLAEEERRAALRLEAELQAAAGEQLRKESAWMARLRRPASPPNPHSVRERARWSFADVRLCSVHGHHSSA